MVDIDGDLLNLLQQELNTQGKDGKARSRGTGATKRASGGRRAKLNYEKQVQLLEQELNAKMTLARQLEGQKRALTENLQMLELHCKATGHYVQLMQEGEQQARATAWLRKHTTAARNGGASRDADQGSLGLEQGQAKQQQPEAGTDEDITEGMDWHQLLDGLTDVPGDQAPGSASRPGAKLGFSGGEGPQQGVQQHRQQQQQQPPKDRCLSLNDVPVSDRPNEAWLAAMRRATVDDFANVIREFVTIAGPLVLQAEAHGGLTPALNHLCLHVTKYMEFSNVLAIARSRTLYEAIEVDLETRAPRKPPHGFWANVAAVMRCTPEQMQQVQAAMRSYTTSLSAISDERMLLSRELSATIQASEAAAQAVGQGSRGAVEQAAAANELQQLLAKRLAGNVQRQVLCHSMLRVYHTRKVFTPVQIAKAIICSWPFVANVPSIWAAILEASMLSPDQSPDNMSQQPVSPTEPGPPVPFPSANHIASIPEVLAESSRATANPAPSLGIGQWGVGAQPAASASYSGVGHIEKRENSVHGGQHGLAGLALAEHGAGYQRQQQQPQPMLQAGEGSSHGGYQRQQQLMLQAGEGSSHGGRQFAGLETGLGTSLAQHQQQQHHHQQQQQHALLAMQGAVAGGGERSAHGGQLYFTAAGSPGVSPAVKQQQQQQQQQGLMPRKGSLHRGLQSMDSIDCSSAGGVGAAAVPTAPMSAAAAAAATAVAAPQQPGSGMLSRRGSTHGSQHFFDPAQSTQHLYNPAAAAAAAVTAAVPIPVRSREGSAHGGQHCFKMQAPPAAAAQVAGDVGSANCGQHFFNSSFSPMAVGQQTQQQQQQQQQQQFGGIAFASHSPGTHPFLAFQK